KALATELASRPPRPLPAHLNVKQVTTVTDRTIKVRLNTDQTIRVDVLAYQTNDETQTTGPTPFGALDQLLSANEDNEITVLQLTEDKPYILRIKEKTTASDPQGRVVINEIITGGPTGPLRTKKAIDLPTIAPMGLPPQRRNDAVHFAYNPRNAPSVIASVEAFNNGGETSQV